MITEDYVSFETAKLLKEKGFDEPCSNRYYETHSGFDLGLDPGYTNSHWEDIYKDMGVRNYSAPTLQMAMKWLREKELYINVWADPKDVEHDNFTIVYRMMIFNGVSNYGTYEFPSYEEACETAIKYCLENLI